MESRNMNICSSIIVCIIFAVAFIACGNEVSRASAEMEDFRAAVSEEYGVTDIHFRERTSPDVVFIGEPYGAYLYTGYVGGNMTEEDLQSLQIIATGPEVKPAVDHFSELYDRWWGWSCVAVFSAIMSVLALVYALVEIGEAYKYRKIYRY